MLGLVSKYVLHIHTTYQSGIVGQEGEQDQPNKKMVRNAEKFLYSLSKRFKIIFEASTV